MPNFVAFLIYIRHSKFAAKLVLTAELWKIQGLDNFMRIYSVVSRNTLCHETGYANLERKSVFE